MKSRKKLLAILMAAVMALTSITVALAVTTADNVKTEGFEMPAPVEQVSNNVPDNIPELGDWAVLKHYSVSEDYPISNNPNILSGGDEGVAALYPNGELYYINETDEIKLSDQAKDYAYIGEYVYAEQVSILDQDGTLWDWRWEEGAEEPVREKVMDNVADISDTGRTILKTDGTLWKRQNASYDLSSTDRNNIKAILDANDDLYVKNDNTTWRYNRYGNDEQIANFRAIDATIHNTDDKDEDRWGYVYFYFVVDESGAVWKIRENNPSDCQKIAEGFASWEREVVGNGIYGFRTVDGYSYDLETGAKTASALDADKTLWLTELDNPIPILNDVEAYRVERDGEKTIRTYVMVRIDGSIWAYHLNGIGMDAPVMIKAPIGGEPLPTYTLGDVNLDGKVNTSDARLALRGAAKLEALTPQQILAADVNKNGKADTSDARKILRVAAKLDQF